MNALFDLVESALGERSFSIYEAMERQEERRLTNQREAEARVKWNCARDKDFNYMPYRRSGSSDIEQPDLFG